MTGIYTIALLIISNIFMTVAWYGHLRLKNESWFTTLSLPLVILLSWGIALFEYAFQVPANRIGFEENGGPFTLWQLKIAQEAITLTVFTAFTLLFFRDQPLEWKHLASFACLIAAVYFAFK